MDQHHFGMFEIQQFQFINIRNIENPSEVYQWYLIGCFVDQWMVFCLFTI